MIKFSFSGYINLAYLDGIFNISVLNSEVTVTFSPSGMLEDKTLFSFSSQNKIKRVGEA